MFLMLSSYAQYQTFVQKAMYVYHVKNATAIDLVHGSQSVILADSTFLSSSKLSLFNIQQNHNQIGIEHTEQIPLDDFVNGEYINKNIDTTQLMLSNAFLQFDDKRMMLPNDYKIQYYQNTEIAVDYLLLTQNININLHKLAECVHFDYVIADASNSRWRNRKWAEQCTELEVAYYNVHTQGAFVERW